MITARRATLVLILTGGALAVATVGGALGGAIWTVLATSSLPAAAAVLGSTVAVCLGLLGVFQEYIRNVLWGPDLELVFSSSDETGDIQFALVGPELPARQRFSYYARLRAFNDGDTTAENVEVIARSVHRLDPATGGREPLPSWMPMNLCWSHTNSAVQRLPPGTQKHVDLFYVLDPRFDNDGNVQVPPERQHVVMCFVVFPKVHPGVMYTGSTYFISVLVAADKTKAKEFVVKVSFPASFVDEGLNFTAKEIEMSCEPLQTL